jgi:hypothetical protein
MATRRMKACGVNRRNSDSPSTLQEQQMFRDAAFAQIDRVLNDVRYFSYSDGAHAVTIIGKSNDGRYTIARYVACGGE